MTDKTLRIAMKSSRVSLESDRPFTGVYHVTYHIYDALAAPTIRTLPDGRKTADFSQVYGRLAESFEPNADFSRWIVHLRRGVTSHAGNELTSADVVWSYKRAFALRAIGMWRSSVLAGVALDGVEAIDRYSVSFTINGSNPNFRSFLCYGTCAIVDSVEAQKHATANDPWAGDYLKSTPCGFGGWDLVEQTDTHLSLKPRPEFWAGAPPVDGVVYRSAATREEGIALYESGEVNLLPGLYPDEAEYVKTLPNTKLLLGRTNHATLEFNRERAPFDSRDVREAVMRAIPYQRIIDEGYLGYAELQHGIFQPNTPGFTAEDWPYDADLDKARSLASGAAGSSVTLAIVASPEAARIGTIIGEALAEIGLTVSLVQIQDVKDGSTVDMYLRDDCSHGIADPHYDLAIDFAPPRNMPNRLFSGVRLSDRLRDIRLAPADQKTALYRQTQQDLLADAACVPIAGHNYVLAYREPIDPWFFSEAYLPLNSLLWSAARYILPPYR